MRRACNPPPWGRIHQQDVDQRGSRLTRIVCSRVRRPCQLHLDVCAGPVGAGACNRVQLWRPGWACADGTAACSERNTCQAAAAAVPPAGGARRGLREAGTAPGRWAGGRRTERLLCPSADGASWPCSWPAGPAGAASGPATSPLRGHAGPSNGSPEELPPRGCPSAVLLEHAHTASAAANAGSGSVPQQRPRHATARTRDAQVAFGAAQPVLRPRGAHCVRALSAGPALSACAVARHRGTAERGAPLPPGKTGPWCGAPAVAAAAGQARRPS